jgi:hypothetical protein
MKRLWSARTMRLRTFVVLLLAWFLTAMPGADAQADSSSRELASYYERHMALVDGVAHGRPVGLVRD